MSKKQKKKQKDPIIQNSETNEWLDKKELKCEFLKVGWEDDQTHIAAFITKDTGIVEFYTWEDMGDDDMYCLGEYNLKTKEFTEDYGDGRWYNWLQQHIAYLEAVIKGAGQDKATQTNNE